MPHKIPDKSPNINAITLSLLLCDTIHIDLFPYSYIAVVAKSGFGSWSHDDPDDIGLT
jgi:hypothetical protein